MTPTRQAWVWGLALVVLGLVLHVLGPILLPFVVGFAVAYFLDPVVVWLGRHRIGRAAATLLVLVLFFAVIVLAISLIAPVVQRQVLDFAHEAPELAGKLQARVMHLVARISAQVSPADVERLKAAAGSIAGDVLKFAGQFAGKIWSGGLALLNVLSLVFIAPLVAFYLLRDWHGIITKIDGWLPRDHAGTIRALAREADTMIAGYMRGVAMVCLTLAVFYAVALSIIGLDFGLVIGLVAGLISFIPFVGSAVGFIVSVGVAIVQFGDPVQVAITAAVFIAGQVLDGHFLTPKLVGERIRLHPVWVIFALLAGGLLYGFVGVLLAVPVAAVIGVLARFAIGQYLGSRLYRGNESGLP